MKNNIEPMITKEKLYTLGAIALGLAAVYFFSKSFGALFLMAAGIAGGWYLKGKFGSKVEEAIDNAQNTVNNVQNTVNSIENLTNKSKKKKG